LGVLIRKGKKKGGRGEGIGLTDIALFFARRILCPREKEGKEAREGESFRGGEKRKKRHVAGSTFLQPRS